jgi:hypothetical protein
VGDVGFGCSASARCSWRRIARREIGPTTPDTTGSSVEVFTVSSCTSARSTQHKPGPNATIAYRDRTPHPLLPVRCPHDDRTKAPASPRLHTPRTPDSAMSELEVPSTNVPTTVPSITEHGVGATLPHMSGSASASAEEKGPTVNGHGRGYDGVNGNGTAHGHGEVKCVTMAVVGAGQRGQVSKRLGPKLHLRLSPPSLRC